MIKQPWDGCVAWCPWGDLRFTDVDPWPSLLSDLPTPSRPPPLGIPQALSFREVSGFREEDGGLIGQDLLFAECETQAKQSLKSITLFNLHQNPSRAVLQLQSSPEETRRHRVLSCLARGMQVVNIRAGDLNSSIVVPEIVCLIVCSCFLVLMMELKFT